MSNLSGLVRHDGLGSTRSSRLRSGAKRPFSRLVPFSLISAAVILFDFALILGTSVLAGCAYHLVSLGELGPIGSFVAVGVLTAVNFAALLAAHGSYQPHNLTDFSRQAREVSAVWLFTLLLLALVAFALKVSGVYSRGATLTFFAAGWGTIVSWRFAAGRLITTALSEGGFAEQKVILLADEAQLNGSSIANELYRYGYRSAQTFKLPAMPVSPTGSAQISKMMDDIIEISRTEPIECVFLLISWTNTLAAEQLLSQLRILSIPVYLLPDCTVEQFLNYRLINIGGHWTAELKRAPLTSSERWCKRLIDLLLASVALVMLAPLLLLVALFLKCENRGPVLFTQTRNGFNGRPFRMCKFRTMSVSEDGAVVRQATKNDPRVTTFGRVLRRTNLDELPQLFNVIAGDMSLVGPRPHAAAHNSEYEKRIANYAFRYHVKPGLTGWAQINGYRGETKTIDLMEKRVECDLWYIENWSLWLDFKIMIRTLVLGLQPTAY